VVFSLTLWPGNNAALPYVEPALDYRRRQGLDTDYLLDHGGEAKIVPSDGMLEKRSDGTTTQWKRYLSYSPFREFP